MNLEVLSDSLKADKYKAWKRKNPLWILSFHNEVVAAFSRIDECFLFVEYTLNLPIDLRHLSPESYSAGGE